MNTNASPQRGSIPHDSAHGQVTGEALYIDDLAPLAGELVVEIVGSPVARGTLDAIDADAARALPGVVGIYTAADLPGHNLWGPIIVDEPILPARELRYLGQPIAIIAAETREAARAARRAVVVRANEEPPVLTIDDAIARREFIGVTRRIARGGDVSAVIDAAPHQLDGELRIGGQEQFYFESQAAIAIPGEFGQITIHSSTQNPTEVQIVVAEALHLSMHEVICVCKRMGGGFGGKETQSVLPAVYAALVAHHTRRPARCVYSKDDDMKITGKRHAYRCRWRAGFDDEGRVRGVRLEWHSDGGAFADLSTSVMERTMLHSDNAYYLPVCNITGTICRTNVPPNTAFRGFGGPQGITGIETILEAIARHLGVDALDVRRANLYGTDERNVAPYGQLIRDNTLPQVFATLERTADYRARRRAVAAFNARSRTHLRGLALTGLKFGISFTAAFLNQGNALVNVYLDGTIQVSTGATEMGQGVNTKMRQIVADEFGIAIDRVLVMATSTEKNINTSPTAASASTDLNGAATRNACLEIKARMADFAARHFADGASPARIRFADGHVFDERAPQRRVAFGEFCRLCRLNRIDIGARGFFATPGVAFDRESGTGTPFFYYTTGAAAAEVVIDRHTGELTIDRIDLLMDIGRPINAAIDRGQVIGGFVQGMGWCTTEELVYDQRGALLSHSPTTYKIPAISDLPRVFNVAFIENDRNVANIGASKAVGEPPLLLGICAWMAVKDALAHLAPPGADVDLKLPATGEEILRALEALKRTAAPAPANGHHARKGNGATAPPLHGPTSTLNVSAKWSTE